MTTDEILNKVANHRQKQHELVEEWGQLREQALQECLRLIETFEFSASELNFGKDGRQAKPVIKNVGAPKFQNPDGPETWTGRGKRPAWYIKAKEAGFTDEDMFIEPAAADTEAQPT